MSLRLSKDKIESFCGDVLPLRLFSDAPTDRICWEVEGDAVQLRSFSEEEELPFDTGVLLTLLRPGTAVVTATADGEVCRCQVTVTKRLCASSDDEMQYFIGDFHDHTTNEHNHDRFRDRTCGFPWEYIRQVKEENKLDFCVISDHGGTLNPRDFFRGFTDAEDMKPMDLIVFPGCESEVTAVSYDRYGVPHKNSGEIVTVNGDSFTSSYTWSEFLRVFEHSPNLICTLAHPQILGYSVPGIWNFALDQNNTPEFLRMTKMVEMGDGSDRSSNLINEYTYSVALDNGFRVGTTCSSDSHGPLWGYDAFPGKTVIMAPEKSKEAFVDALLNNRVYACSSGNLKLSYSVNGMTAPADLPPATKYNFHVRLSFFHEDPSTVPVKCQVISDAGKTVKVIENVDFRDFTFTVESETAGYFYLRLTDTEGRKTWSVPVWTERSVIPRSRQALTPIEKRGCKAYDLHTGKEVPVLLNDRPTESWCSQSGTAEIVIDLQTEQEICGLGHYPTIIDRRSLPDPTVPVAELVARFPVDYRISTSCDNVTYTTCAEGLFRIFGGEEVISFAAHTARYVKLQVLSTAGKASEYAKYQDAKVSMAELTVYKK